MNEIEPITPLPLPFSMDEKIFVPTDEEGNRIGENYSYNDWLKEIDNISGINEELMGKNE